MLVVLAIGGVRIKTIEGISNFGGEGLCVESFANQIFFCMFAVNCVQFECKFKSKYKMKMIF